MNGININTKDTVIILNLLVVEEMCVNATGANATGSPLFPSMVSLFSPGQTSGRSQPLLNPSFCFLLEPTESD